MTTVRQMPPFAAVPLTDRTVNQAYTLNKPLDLFTRYSWFSRYVLHLIILPQMASACWSTPQYNLSCYIGFEVWLAGAKGADLLLVKFFVVVCLS